MGKENIQFGINFGILANHIGIQIKKQKLKYDPKIIAPLQNQTKALMELRFADLLPDKVYDAAVAKIYKRVVNHVTKFNKLKANK